MTGAKFFHVWVTAATYGVDGRSTERRALFLEKFYFGGNGVLLCLGEIEPPVLKVVAVLDGVYDTILAYPNCLDTAGSTIFGLSADGLLAGLSSDVREGHSGRKDGGCDQGDAIGIDGPVGS